MFLLFRSFLSILSVLIFSSTLAFEVSAMERRASKRKRESSEPAYYKEFMDGIRKQTFEAKEGGQKTIAYTAWEDLPNLLEALISRESKLESGLDCNKLLEHLKTSIVRELTPIARYNYAHGFLERLFPLNFLKWKDKHVYLGEHFDKLSAINKYMQKHSEFSKKRKISKTKAKSTSKKKKTSKTNAKLQLQQKRQDLEIEIDDLLKSYIITDNRDTNDGSSDNSSDTEEESIFIDESEDESDECELKNEDKKKKKVAEFLLKQAAEIDIDSLRDGNEFWFKNWLRQNFDNDYRDAISAFCKELIERGLMSAWNEPFAIRYKEIEKQYNITH